MNPQKKNTSTDQTQETASRGSGVGSNKSVKVNAETNTNVGGWQSREENTTTYNNSEVNNYTTINDNSKHYHICSTQ
ncbi:hypothetical protein AGMMS49921_08620 [Endomicrobiia bacterium]|nr:hypothetical protein AGMMS49921_08620 [Endomicrobiia bacterium]